MTTGIAILGMTLLLLLLDLAKTHLEKIQLQEKVAEPARARWRSLEAGDIFISWDEVMEKTRIEKG